MYNSIKMVNKKLSTPVSLICPLQIFVQEEESLGVSEYPSLSGEIISPFFSTDPPYQNFVYTAMANMPRITIYTQSPLHHSDQWPVTTQQVGIYSLCSTDSIIGVELEVIQGPSNEIYIYTSS